MLGNTGQHFALCFGAILNSEIITKMKNVALTVSVLQILRIHVNCKKTRRHIITLRRQTQAVLPLCNPLLF